MANERKLFAKEKFCEGNRQKWLIIFLIYLTIIMTLDAFHLLKDVTPYLTFLTFLAGAFILGYSGTETMKLFRASSADENQNISEQNNHNSTFNENRNINVSEQFLTNNAKESDYNIQNINA